MEPIEEIENFVKEHELATIEHLGYTPSDTIATIEGLYAQANQFTGSCKVTAMIVENNTVRIKLFAVNR